jgi:hypothetical protein
MGASVAVYQPRYYPRLHYLARAQMVDTFVLYDDVEFSRQSPQHRAQIEFGGKKWLTVPVKRTGNDTLIVDAGIDMNRHWRRTHLNTLQAKYGGDAAAQFESFYEALDDDARLVELTVPILAELFDRFDVDSDIVRSSRVDFERTDDASANLARLIETLDGTEYISGGRGYRNYLDETPFDERGIDVSVQDWDPEWDDGNVCSLDVLFEADDPTTHVR